eukprot:TRINITY_DN21144_c0_g1_i1.p1 TRINITY_DN21144_c0_g1~~TRINITY_DN21144_c0_g1_i1.p1  ORF type:complete len:359 (+),score=77.07 TRINITY_DN21144_c0_g1_i1:69-1079(+)
MSEAIIAAAAALRKANALLILTGAGMGVDSGLGTFRGRNAGVWPPLKAMQVDFSEMSSPDWFQEDPRLGWAFWHFRHQAYTGSTPHEGYAIMAAWGAAMEHGFFSVTSNIDGHWERTVGADRVSEVHGAVTRMQPLNGADHEGSIWPTDPAEIEAMRVPVWDLAPGDKVEAQVGGGEWQPAVVAADGCSIADASGQGMRCSALRRPGGPDLLRVLPDSPLPRVPGTTDLARPNVLMFGDWGVDCTRIWQQDEAFRGWLDKLPPGVKLAIVEVGAGTAVPTIRHLAEEVAERHKDAVLIRVNLEQSDVPADLARAGRAIAVPGMGALEAIRAIAAHI